MTRILISIGLISLTLLPLELTWTRIFSAEFFYTFAFLVLSLAILGLGMGALMLRLCKSADRDFMISVYLALSGLCALIGPIVVFRLGLDFSALFSSWGMVGKLMLTVLILMSAFFFGGMSLAMIFKRRSVEMPNLYMADLLGAGLGLLVALWGMNLFGTPVASALVALPILVASFLLANGWMRTVPVAVAIAVLLVAPGSEERLTAVRKEPAPIIYTHWDATSKLKLYEFGPEYRGLNIDNVANSPVHRFDGKWEDINPDSVEWGIDVSYLIQRFDSCRFLSLGAGGGGDVLQALVEGATEVHAVEVNPHINWMMLHDDTTGYHKAPFVPESSWTSAQVDSAKAIYDTTRMLSVAEFTGHLYKDPRVRVVTEDARSYVRRFENKFDVIYSLSSNSWAALASGAFALAENYLFTTEAFEDYWDALSDSGFLMMEHQVYTPRLVSEALAALENRGALGGASGIGDPSRHIAVYDLPKMRRKILLMSKRPLTDSLRYYALGPLTPERFDQIHLLYPPANDSLANNQIARIVTEGWRKLADSAKIDLSPVSDNRPFVAQLGLWRNLTKESMQKVTNYAEFSGFPLSKVTLLIILAVVVIIVLPINLLPYFTQGEKLTARPWLYFFAIGVGFMVVEVVLIQKYALLIGASLHSIITVLLTLLVASGIGSRFARQFSNKQIFAVILGWLLLDALVFRYLIGAAGGWPLAMRIALAVILIAPLGFFMGMPFPKGAIRVGSLVDWGFAVNGAASVLGSVLAVLIAINYGFSVAVLFGALSYLLAFLVSLDRDLISRSMPVE